jgi:4-amino-4-deoxy-L-arabinose transferase-like glycosyltransferase
MQESHVHAPGAGGGSSGNVKGWQPWPATHALIFLFVLLHLALAASVPLIAFETHYALYGLHLDWSYFDHPPMVGWVQALVQQFSHSDFAMRLGPIAITTASQYLVALLALRLFPKASPWLGFVTVLILQGAIIMHASIAMAPEIPLLFAGLLVIWFTLQVLQRDGLVDWLGLGFALGLAGLSKYTAITLAFSVLIALWGGGRLGSLLKPRAWLALGLAALLVSPVLIWNYQHDWASFKFQLGYQLDNDDVDSAWSLADAFDMQLEQLGTYSPLLFIGGVAAAVWGIGQGRGARLLLVFALPNLLMFAYMAGVGRSSVHWTLFGWVAMSPLCAAWLMSQWRRRAVRGLVYVSATLSTLGLLVIMLLPLPFIPFPDYNHPLGRVLGWQQAASRAELLRQEMAGDGGSEPVLLVTNWHYAGPLAWYAQPTIARDTNPRPSQYKLWYGYVDASTRGILVVFDKDNDSPGFDQRGLDCHQVDTMPTYRGATVTSKFYFYRCEPEKS